MRFFVVGKRVKKNYKFKLPAQDGSLWKRVAFFKNSGEDMSSSILTPKSLKAFSKMKTNF